MNSRIALVPCLLLLSQPLIAAPASFSEPIDCARSEYFFDTDRISQDSLEEVLTFSPGRQNDWNPVNGLYHCPPDFPNCDPSFKNSSNIIEDAENDLKPLQESLQKLRSYELPKELKPIADYYEKQYEFRYANQKQLAEYFKSWDLAVLKKKSVWANPALNCAPTLALIEKAKDKPTKWKLATFDWVNCVGGDFGKKVGWYPKEVWAKFLKANGIRYEYEVKDKVCD